MAIDNEQIDRAIDMIEKVRGIAEEKGFIFNTLVKQKGTRLKNLPSIKEIRAHPDEHVPVVIAEMRSLLSIITKR